MKRPTGRALFCGLAALLTALCFLWLRHPGGTERIPLDDSSHISSLSVWTREEGMDETLFLSGEELSAGLEADLLGCIGAYSMSKRTRETGQAMEIADPYIYISLRIRGSGGKPLRVSVSNVAAHSSVQFENKEFPIPDSGPLLEELRRLLAAEG